MKQSNELNELAAALSKTQAALNRAKESATNPFLKNSYADLGDVWDAARAPMTDNGLSVAQFPTSTPDSIGLTTVLLHSSGQWIEDTVYLPLSDERGKSQAQVAGSIISYLRRYGLSAVLGIVTGEDDDGNAGSDPRAQRRQPQPRQDARGETSPAAQAEREGNRPGRNGDIKPPMPTEAMKKKFHALGVELYGDAWDDKRLQLTRHISGKREEGPQVDSSNELYRAEMQSLIDGMLERKESAAA